MQSGLALVPRVAVMMVATPVVGRLYNRVSPRLLVAVGVLAVALGSWDLGQLTLQTTSAGVVRAILVQGLGFAFLFVPLTTAALSGVPRARLADATGLNSLLRQVGGSVGLALFATLLSRYQVSGRAAIVAHLAPERPAVQERLAALASGFAARGLDAVSARLAALRALAGGVERQAATLAFEKTFLLSAIVFVCVLPLLLFLKVNRRAAPVDAHAALE
jgi:DHA2 family multidrug resistance protein